MEKPACWIRCSSSIRPVFPSVVSTRCACYCLIQARRRAARGPPCGWAAGPPRLSATTAGAARRVVGGGRRFAGARDGRRSRALRAASVRCMARFVDPAAGRTGHNHGDGEGTRSVERIDAEPVVVAGDAATLACRRSGCAASKHALSRTARQPFLAIAHREQRRLQFSEVHCLRLGRAAARRGHSPGRHRACCSLAGASGRRRPRPAWHMSDAGY